MRLLSFLVGGPSYESLQTGHVTCGYAQQKRLDCQPWHQRSHPSKSCQNFRSSRMYETHCNSGLNYQPELVQDFFHQEGDNKTQHVVNKLGMTWLLWNLKFNFILQTKWYVEYPIDLSALIHPIGAGSCPPTASHPCDSLTSMVTKHILVHLM